MLLLLLWPASFVPCWLSSPASILHGFRLRLHVSQEDEELLWRRACNASGQGQIMLGFAVIALLAGLVALFARNWGTDTGPGALTKLKIFITHLQVRP